MAGSIHILRQSVPLELPALGCSPPMHAMRNIQCGQSVILSLVRSSIDTVICDCEILLPPNSIVISIERQHLREGEAAGALYFQLDRPVVLPSWYHVL